MKISFAPLLFCFLLPSAFADDNGGLKKDTAPPPAHALGKVRISRSFLPKLTR